MCYRCCDLHKDIQNLANELNPSHTLETCRNCNGVVRLNIIHVKHPCRARCSRCGSNKQCLNDPNCFENIRLLTLGEVCALSALLLRNVLPKGRHNKSHLKADKSKATATLSCRGRACGSNCVWPTSSSHIYRIWRNQHFLPKYPRLHAPPFLQYLSLHPSDDGDGADVWNTASLLKCR